MKRYVICLVCLMVISGCALWPFGRRKDGESKKDASAKVQIKNLRKKYKYIAENWAKIEGGDVSSARDTARDRARAELAKMIKVRITDVITDELGKSAQVESYEIFKKKTEVYTDIILGKPDEQDWYEFYPTKDEITYVLCVSEETVNEWVREDLRKKKQPIEQYVNSASKELKAKKYSSALANLVKARNLSERLFTGMSIESELNGTPVELNSFIGTKIAELMGGIEIIELDKNVVYTAEGKIKPQPRIQMIFKDDVSGEKTPLENFPLKARFISGKGKLIEEFNTGSLGMTELNISEIDPSNRSTSIKVEIDLEQLKVKKTDILRVPSVSITMKKMQTIALATAFYNAGIKTNITSFSNDLRDFTIRNGYGVVDYTNMSKDITSHDRREARESLNADYLLAVVLITKIEGPDAFGFFTSHINGSAKLYSLDDDNELFAINSPAGTGEHLDKSGAGFEAFSKVSNAFIDRIKERIKTVR